MGNPPGKLYGKPYNTKDPQTVYRRRGSFSTYCKVIRTDPIESGGYRHACQGTSGTTPRNGTSSSRRGTPRSKKATPVEGLAEVDVRAVLHELPVHQIELEMQNEELQSARVMAAEVSEKYQDLFDFAPVGYFLWDADGRICEVNLAGRTAGPGPQQGRLETLRPIRRRGRPVNVCRFLPSSIAGGCHPNV